MKGQEAVYDIRDAIRHGTYVQGSELHPHFHGDPFLLATAIDTCWSQRHDADHAACSLLEVRTGIGLAFGVSTKLESSVMPYFPNIAIVDPTISSSMMDPTLSQLCVESLMEDQPDGRFSKNILAHDGDAKAKKPRCYCRSCGEWGDWRCYFHAIKNTVKHTDSTELGSVPCPGPVICTHLQSGNASSCKHFSSARVSPELSSKVKLSCLSQVAAHTLDLLVFLHQAHRSFRSRSCERDQSPCARAGSRALFGRDS